MICKSVYKIPDGKLVKIELDFSADKIKSVKINGDFFLHPENGVELIENCLKGLKPEKKLIMAAVDGEVKKNSLQLFGITSEGVADAILLAKENAKHEPEGV